MMFRGLGALLLLVLAHPTLAENKFNKDWFWNTDGKDFSYAATVTDNGRILGQYCYFENDTCVYVISLGITCKEGGSYPVLVNADTGAINVELICGHEINDNERAFYITPFDDIDNTVRTASNIGFAVAMESGQFKVVRFSLAGSTYAIESMLDETIARMEQDKERSESYTSGGSEQYL